MGIARTKHNREHPFVQLNKEALWDSNLSLQAVGLWSRCLSRPDNWEWHTTELARACKINIETLRKYINELIQYGYAISVQCKKYSDKKKMVFDGYSYMFFEFPITKEERELYTKELKEIVTNTDFPCTEVPSTVKPLLLKTNSTNPSSLHSEVIEEKESASPPRPSPPPLKKIIPQEALEMAKKLYESVLAVHSKAKTPSFEKWAKEIDLMARADSRSWEEIEEMLRWAFLDGFWYKVIQSPEGLRRNWDKMSAQKSTVKNKSSVASQNKKIARDIKDALYNSGRGSEIYLGVDFVKNKNTGDDILYTLPEEEFLNILCKWFDVRKKV